MRGIIYHRAMRNGIFIVILVAFLSGGASAQTISIPADKVAPLNIWEVNQKITDTSGQFIKRNYEMNQRIWKIHFTKILYDKENKSLQVAGFAGITMEPIDSFTVDNYKIHLCALNNDTIINVKHLNKGDDLKKGSHFNLQYDLRTHPVLIFTSFQRLPRIFDFSFLLK